MKVSKAIIVGIQFLVATIVFGVAALLLVDYFGIVETVKPFVVMSGSMEPAVKLGSVVVARPQVSYQPGDIITFAPNGDRENPVTHRVVFRRSLYGLGSESFYLTAGDANEDFDRWQVRNEQIIGKAIFSIPYLGYLVNFAKQPYGFILLVIVPATIVIYEELKLVGKELARLISVVKNKLGSLKSKKTTSFKRFSINLLSRQERRFPKAGVFIPVIGATLIFASISASFFLDSETSLGNILGAAESFDEPLEVTPTPTPIPPSVADHVVINEVYYDVDTDHRQPPTADENNFEWVELYNPTASIVNLKDWKITDNSATQRTISTSNRDLDPGQFAVLAKAANVFILWTIPSSAEKIPLGEIFGNGLSNTGDRVILRNNLGNIIDEMSYGDDTSIFDPSATDVADGHSLERDPDGKDNDIASDFVDRETPTPGS